jgi:hypothetical protein
MHPPERGPRNHCRAQQSRAAQKEPQRNGQISQPVLRGWRSSRRRQHASECHCGNKAQRRIARQISGAGYPGWILARERRKTGRFLADMWNAGADRATPCYNSSAYLTFFDSLFSGWLLKLHSEEKWS